MRIIVGGVLAVVKSWSFDVGRTSDIPFSELFKVLRMRSGISARSLSIACGLSPSYMSKVESGETKPSLQNFAKIIKALDCSEAEMACLIGAFYDE